LHMGSATLNMACFLPRSRVNGPGARAVIWVQGCSIRCPGCANLHMLDHTPREQTAAADLAERIARDAQAIEGVTLSGGEPFEQAGPLLELVGICREAGLGIMAFSGFTMEEILSSGADDRLALLSALDLLVAGRYDLLKPPAPGWRGSSNQTLHFLTDRYARLRDSPEDLAEPGVECHAQADGDVVVTGFPTRALYRQLCEALGHRAVRT